MEPSSLPLVAMSKQRFRSQFSSEKKHTVQFNRATMVHFSSQKQFSSALQFSKIAAVMHINNVTRKNKNLGHITTTDCTSSALLQI
jgi:hypothetical protein